MACLSLSLSLSTRGREGGLAFRKAKEPDRGATWFGRWSRAWLCRAVEAPHPPFLNLLLMIKSNVPSVEKLERPGKTKAGREGRGRERTGVEASVSGQLGSVGVVPRSRQGHAWVGISTKLRGLR